MINSIQSSVVGEWKSTNYPFDKWESNVIAIPFLDNQQLKICLNVTTSDRADELTKSANNVIQHFLNKSIKDRNELSQIVYSECQSFFELTGFDRDVIKMFRQVKNPEPWISHTIALNGLLDLEDINHVWNFMRAYRIQIFNINETELYLQISFHCDWDDEHGLDLNFKNGVDFAGTKSMF